MDDFAAFTSHEDLYAFGAGVPRPPDPRSHSYPPPFLHQTPNPQLQPQHQQQQPQSWSPLALEAAMKHERASQQQQQQQQLGMHAQHHQQSSNAVFMAPPLSRQPHLPQHVQPQQHTQSQQSSRPNSNHGNQPINVQTSGLDLGYASMLPNNWQYQLQQAAQQQQQYGMQNGNTMNMTTYDPASFGGHLQTSPVEFMPATTTETYSVPASMESAQFMPMAGPMESMNTLVYPLNDYQNDMNFQMNMNSQQGFHHRSNDSVNSSLASSSPTGTILEVQSLSDNEGSWSIVNFNPHRQSFDSIGTVSNPSQNLHIRTNSDSSSSEDPHSADLSGSYEEIPPWPLSSPHDLTGQDYLDAHYDAHYFQQTHGMGMQGQQQASPSSSLAVSPSAGVGTYRSSAGSSSTSPTSSGPTSPPLRRRKSPLEGKTTKAVIKKTPHSARKDAAAEKKVGRRRGPLRPDQRQQAHEIRKLRACLRCKFLKKTCDKGEPCGGCRPSHARLWQVPCTRMDIKDISYFMKDWKADYDRHVSLGFSVNNIKGFSNIERVLYITHGYGHYLPINAREIFVREDKCFNMDWVETTQSVDPVEFEITTAKLSAGMEGVSTSLLSDYLDRHLDQNFESFVDDYFEGTVFLTEILKTAHRYYQRERTPSVRKALKLVLAYNLTLHVTMVEGLSEEEQFQGRVFDDKSKFTGKTIAPVMINFQVKCALADMWRELQKDILEELSALYSSVYSGDKLKNWPTIFMLAAILLAIWEEMQYDSHYRMPDEKEVNKFCEEMETTPVGVIVGLFQAISTKLPGIQEWDTKKHHQLLGSNPAVCDALTEVKGHVDKYEKYLKERQNATFTREDTDCLSNKFLSKLVIRAN